MILFSAIHTPWWAAERAATWPGRVLHSAYATVQGTECCTWGSRLHVLLHGTIWRVRSVNPTWQISLIPTTLIHLPTHSLIKSFIQKVCTSFYFVDFFLSALNHLNCVKIVVRTRIFSCNPVMVQCIFLEIMNQDN